MKYNELINEIKCNSTSQLMQPVMDALLDDTLTIEQQAALITVLDYRKIADEELADLVRFLLAQTNVQNKIHFGLMDVCGTGGDGNNTANISTMVAFTLAAAGVKLAKHGNYGFSSANGSSSLLEYFGYVFPSTVQACYDQIDISGIAFVHAPLFHPVLKDIGKIRKNLGVRTFFNSLGPLLNPLQPEFRMNGVNSLSLARTYNAVYHAQSDLKYLVVYSTDGNDEITLTAPVKYFSNNGSHLLYPNELSSLDVNLSALQHSGSMDSAAQIFRSFLNNQLHPELKEVVLVNAAMAHSVYFSTDFPTSRNEIRDVMESNKIKSLANQLFKNA